MDKQLKDKIKKIRTGKNLTQKEFAESLGVSKAAVQDWEQGRYVPDRRSRIALNRFVESEVF